MNHILKTPEVLYPALRQFQHNDYSGFVTGFDYDETVKIFSLMEDTIKAQTGLLACYRTNKRPAEWIFAVIEKARNAGLKV